MVIRQIRKAMLRVGKQIFFKVSRLMKIYEEIFLSDYVRD